MSKALEVSRAFLLLSQFIRAGKKEGADFSAPSLLLCYRLGGNYSPYNASSRFPRRTFGPLRNDNTNVETMDIKLLLQIAGVLLGLLYLWLEYRADIRLWIVGLVMPLIHGALYYKSGLYADCSMQAYYVLAGLYGWLVWRRRGRKTDAGLTGPEDAEGAKRAAALRIGHTPLRTVPALAGVYAAAHIGLYLLLTRFTDSTVPFWDAGTTALSVVAMWMLSRKLVEQWLVWLVVDLVTVGLYLYKDLPYTAGLYALYSALAVAGYLRWRRQARA